MKNVHYFSQISMKLEFSQHMIEKYSNINFHENLSIGSQVVPCGKNRYHVATNFFRNFSKVSKNGFFGRFLFFPTFSKDTALQKYANL
jgi:hypothetical protein